MIRPISTHFDARVLVVEDYPLNAEVIKEMLEMMGCAADVVENGQQALQFLEDYDYDLVFMDIQMPVMDGITATQEIRRREGSAKHIPIVALTANALEGDKEKYLASGMDDFISKPLSASELERVLSRFATPTSTGG